MVNIPKKVARLVIHTQFRENYGAHAWDGKGECPQNWKYKGGSTYVFDHLDNPFVRPKDYIDEITKLIEFRDDGAEEYVLSADIVDVSDEPWESWDKPIMLSRNFYGNYIAEREFLLNEGTESWVMTPESNREAYHASPA